MKIALPGQDNSTTTLTSGARERSALISATRQLERTPWPEVTEESLSVRMVSALFGAEQKERGITRDEALEIYVTSLERQADPVNALMSDANLTLKQARQVAESGRMAVVAITPGSSDIAVLEDAIAEVRQCREMYLDALRALKREGYSVDRRNEKELKEAFSRTIRDIGGTADIVADRVSEGRIPPQYAGQASQAGN